MDELQKIANKFKKHPRQEVDEYVPKDSVHIAEIEIDGLKRKSGVNIIDKFGVEEGQTYAVADLEYQLNVLYGSQRFKQVQYKLLEKENGSFLMRIEVVEKESDTQIGINLHYDSDFGAAVGLGLIYHDAFIDGASLGIDLLVRNNITAKLYYDYDRGKYPGFYFESRYFNALPSIYNSKKFIGQISLHDWSNYLAVQSSYKRRGNFKIGIGLDFQKYNFDRIPDWIDDPASGIDFSRLNLLHVHWAKVQIDIDNLDSKDFATKGFRLYAQGSLTQLLKESFSAFNFEPFAPISLDYVQAWSPKK